MVADSVGMGGLSVGSLCADAAEGLVSDFLQLLGLILATNLIQLVKHW